MTETKDWRKIVKYSDTLPDHCQDFLDEHNFKNMSSKGMIHLTEPVDTMIPYELCPLRVKNAIRKITSDGKLPLSSFKTKASYQSALCNLHIYGYLQSIDQALVEKRRARSAAKKAWCNENPEAVARYAAHAKTMYHANKDSSTCLSSTHPRIS
jgi:hypothetical protein